MRFPRGPWISVIRPAPSRANVRSAVGRRRLTPSGVNDQLVAVAIGHRLQPVEAVDDHHDAVLGREPEQARVVERRRRRSRRATSSRPATASACRRPRASMSCRCRAARRTPASSARATGPVGGGVRSNTSTRPPGDVTVTKCGMVVLKRKRREREAERLGEPSALAESIVRRRARARELESASRRRSHRCACRWCRRSAAPDGEAGDRRLHVEVRRRVVAELHVAR